MFQGLAESMALGTPLGAKPITEPLRPLRRTIAEQYASITTHFKLRSQPQHLRVRFAEGQVSNFGVFCTAMLL